MSFITESHWDETCMQFGPCSHETLRRDRNVYYIWGWQYYVLV